MGCVGEAWCMAALRGVVCDHGALHRELPRCRSALRLCCASVVQGEAPGCGAGHAVCRGMVWCMGRHATWACGEMVACSHRAWCGEQPQGVAWGTQGAWSGGQGMPPLPSPCAVPCGRAPGHLHTPCATPQGQAPCFAASGCSPHCGCPPCHTPWPVPTPRGHSPCDTATAGRHSPHHALQPCTTPPPHSMDTCCTQRALPMCPLARSQCAHAPHLPPPPCSVHSVAAASRCSPHGGEWLAAAHQEAWDAVTGYCASQPCAVASRHCPCPPHQLPVLPSPCDLCPLAAADRQSLHGGMQCVATG